MGVGGSRIKRANTNPPSETARRKQQPAIAQGSQRMANSISGRFVAAVLLSPAGLMRVIVARRLGLMDGLVNSAFASAASDVDDEIGAGPAERALRAVLCSVEATALIPLKVLVPTGEFKATSMLPLAGLAPLAGAAPEAAAGGMPE